LLPWHRDAFRPGEADRLAVAQVEPAGAKLIPGKHGGDQQQPVLIGLPQRDELEAPAQRLPYRREPFRSGHFTCYRLAQCGEPGGHLVVHEAKHLWRSVGSELLQLTGCRVAGLG
jgi:hypothetical protein